MIYYSKRNKDWEEKLSDEFWNGFKAYIEEIVPLLDPTPSSNTKLQNKIKRVKNFLKDAMLKKKAEVAEEQINNYDYG